MKCPNCKKKVGSKDNVCMYCGTLLKVTDKKFKHAENPPLVQDSDIIDVTEVYEDKSPKKHGMRLKTKLIIILSLLAVLTVIVILSINSYADAKGERLGANAALHIGESLGDAENKIGYRFRDKSSYSVINNAVDYDYIGESEESVEVEGINYPCWAVLVKTDKNDKIQTVKYSNFQTLKKGMKGQKSDRVINLERFVVGDSIEEVESFIKLPYYCVTYTNTENIYSYKYWYTNEDGDAQQAVLDVYCDNDNEYIRYNTKLLYPENL